ncbi:MAG: DUF938 domain-containing protein [Steroidobacteraceae bacterium]
MPDPEISLLFSPASERNKAPILERLRVELADCREVLEIGSGTLQHAIHFSVAMPWLRWQPTDTAAQFAALNRACASASIANIATPLELDVDQPQWPETDADAMFSANTLHIMAWPSVVGMFRQLGLMAGLRRVIIYGPFKYRGAFTTASNEQFDQSLKRRDRNSGIRDFEAVNQLAQQSQLRLAADHAMPANNQLLVWHRN